MKNFKLNSPVFTSTLIVFFTVLTMSLSAQGSDESQNKRVRQYKYMAFLSEKGYTPSIDSDGDIKFKHEDRTVHITIDANDESFFRLVIIGSLTLDSYSEKLEVYEICNQITANKKVTKVYWYNDSIWASTELMFADVDDYEGIFERVLDITYSAYEEFIDLYSEL